MSKHTPGPWRIVDRERLEDGTVYPRHIIGGARDLEVCQLESQVIAGLAANDPGGLYDHDAMAESADDVRSKKANADLIAAAPDLLDAANITLRALEAEYGRRGAEVNFTALYDAIAKAEGRA